MLLWACCFLPVGLFATSGQVMTGEPRQVPANTPGVLAAARFAVVEFNRGDTEDQFAYKIMNITSAKIQVVTGLNYILDVQLVRTTCKISDTSDGEPCVSHSEPKKLLCHFIVTVIPWKNSLELIKKKC